jgi:hypothetical protein
MRRKMMRLHAISGVTSIEFESMGFSTGSRPMPVFHVIGVAPNIETLMVPEAALSNFFMIDAQPQITELPIRSTRDLNVFATPLTRTQEVLIDQADLTVIEHLEAIKRLQSDKQKELRANALNATAARNCTPRTNVIAQLVSYERAA